MFLALALSMLSGCGHDAMPDAPGAEESVRTYLGAVFELNYDAACGQLSPDAEADLVDYTRDLPEPPTGCESAIEALGLIGSLDSAAAGVMDFHLVTADAATAPIEEVDSEGTRVVLRVDDSRKTVSLAEHEGVWTIDELDFSDLPK